MNFICQTWPWYFSGFCIGILMLAIIYFGKAFGLSSNLRSLCAMTGVGKKVSFFDFDWKSNRWNLYIVFGSMLGGYFSVHFLSAPTNVSINPKTIAQLTQMGIDAPNGKLLPDALFGNIDFLSPKIISILVFPKLLIASIVPSVEHESIIIIL